MALSLTANEYHVTVVTLSWILGFALPRLAGRRLSSVRSVGVALVAWPFVRMAVNVVLSADALTRYEVLDPIPRAELYDSLVGRVLHYVAVPVLGILVARGVLPSRGGPALLRRGGAAIVQETDGIAASLKEDARMGSALVPVMFLAYLGVFLILYRALEGTTLDGGDESAVWNNMTPLLMVLLAAASGVSEELLFRGILQRRLVSILPLPAAIGLQAAFFGLVHAGYGTWSHVVGPTLFGVAMSVVALRLGLAAAAVIHAELNFGIFVLDGVDRFPWMYGALAVLLALDAYVLLSTRAAAFRLLLTRPRGGRNPPAAPLFFAGRKP